ncbi:MAG: DNA polymerase I [Bacteroidetes bacterium]|nr:DNA polymerase I [Bacteroidota bacterium]
MSEKKLFLLDGMALIYRAFFAFKDYPRITSTGLNTSAVFGFANTLLEVLQKEKPTHIAVVFDTAAPTERHIEYEQYKAHREAMPEDLSISIPYVFRLIEGMNIPVITMDGYEADDIIGTLAKQAEKEDFMTYMMTPDKDFAQLVSDKIFIHKPARMGNGAETIGVAEVLKKWEIERVEQVIDILGLWGDAVDNIPGVPGVGEKTAKKLIQEYGSMENIIANAANLKGVLKEKFVTYQKQALLSKKLATINLSVPINLDDHLLIIEEPNFDLLEPLFQELEFKTMAARISGKPTSSPTAKIPAPNAQTDLFGAVVENSNFETIIEENIHYNTIENTPHAYHLISTKAERETLIANLLQQAEFCFDTETTGLDALNASVIGLAFSYKATEGYYVSISLENAAEILTEFKPVFSSKSLKIAQNLKYDLQVLSNHNIQIEGPFFDTMLAHYIIEPDKRHNMDALAEQYLKYSPVSIETLIGKKGKNQLNMSDIDLQKVKEYAAEDADITFQIKQHIAHEVVKQNSLSVLNEIEIPLVPVLAAIEREGIRIDQSFLQNYSIDLQKEITVAETNIFDLAGVTFNIASPKQLGEILFDKLMLDDKAKKTKTGQYQTGEDVLVKLANKSAIVKEILDFRQLQKLKSTYVDALPLLVNTTTGRVHTSFNQAVAATGRLSSTNPNLQNIPIRTDRGKEVRKAFIPRNEDFLILSADYSQIELRIVASISEDPNMMEAFLNNKDIHLATAAKVYKIAESEVNKDQRRNAKSVNFGIIYGQQAFGLSENLGISRSEAKELIDNYYAEFVNIKQYMDNQIGMARKHGYVETLMGRKRWLRDINSNNATVRNFAERMAINAPIQGSAADMIKVAMIHIYNEMKKRGLKSKMILQVHDELLFDVHKTEIEELKLLVTELMANAMPLKVPVLAEAGIGVNWLEAL